MVAHTAPIHDDPAAAVPRQQDDPVADDGFDLRPNRGGVRRLVSSIARLADIQFHIWMTEAKLAVSKIVLYVALFGAAALIAVLGVIFLFIGVFHVLTDVFGLAPVWAYLLFGGIQLAIAVTLVLIAKNALNKPAAPATHAADGGK